MTELAKEKINAIHEALKEGKQPPSITVRELLGWFGAERRGYMVSYTVRRTLELLGIQTKPDFDSVPLSRKIEFCEINPEPAAQVVCTDTISDSDQTTGTPEIIENPPELISGALTEPALRVSRLPAASAGVVSVKPDSPLIEAVTLMLQYDYSQLPVMTEPRTVKGIISWESITPIILRGDSEGKTVKDFMKEHTIISSTDSIFSAIPKIVENSYVLVQERDRTISGIITTTDLSSQFRQLSEPFLLLSEIENHIRKLIDGKFSEAELKSAANPEDNTRTITSVANLTFGEYIRLLEKPRNWDKSQIKLDRNTFIDGLDKIREIRNNVMHFDPDGISEQEHAQLHNYVRFLHRLNEISS